MKFVFLFVLGFGSSLQAAAFDLMKCSGSKNGTLWASFGRYTQSGQTEGRLFPTEVVVFAPGFQGREVFLNDIEKALTNEIVVRGALLRMTFTVTVEGRTQRHVLQLLRPYANVPNGFQGNWTISEAGQPDQYDLAFCTIN